MIDYEQEVKRVYKKAKCFACEFGYVVLNAFMQGISHEKETELAAWQSAYDQLKNEGKITT